MIGLFGKKKKDDALEIDSFRLPPGAELEHILIPATTGSGKTQLIQKLLNRILRGVDKKCGEKALITDPGGIFASTRAEDQDLVLNPADRRSKRWNPFSEIRDQTDYDLLAKAVIPDEESKGQETEWRNYARTMLISLMKGLKNAQNPDPREVQRLIATVDPETLRPYLAGTPAEALLAPANERFFGSVLGVLSNSLAPWEHLDPAGAFSIREWVRNGTGVLFLTYTDAQIESLRPLIGCWLSLAIRETLSLPIEADDRGAALRRIWFVTDELDSLGTVHGLADALSRGRKYGLSVISAIQSIAQLRIRYGKDGAQALMSCYVNKLVMRQGDFEDAKHWSDFLGQFEEERISRTEGRSRASGQISTNENRSARREIRQFVLPSELQALPKFCGYARISGIPEIVPFRFAAERWPENLPAFVPKR